MHLSLHYKDLYPSIRFAIHAVWQNKWEAIVATTKMREITTKAIKPWTYAHVRGFHRENRSVTRQNIPNSLYLWFPHVPECSALL